MILTVTPSENLSAFVLTGLECSPVDIKYDILGLHKKRNIVKGELFHVEYYLSFDETTKTYQNLAVKETNTYIRKADFVYKREKKIEWFLLSGQVGAEKNTVKYYSDFEAITEGKARRANIIDDVKHKAWERLGPVDAFRILSVFKPYIDLYIEGALEPLYSALATSKEPYLDNLLPDSQKTIRDFLLEFITI